MVLHRSLRSLSTLYFFHGIIAEIVTAGFSARTRDVMLAGTLAALAVALGIATARVQWAGYVLAALFAAPALLALVYFIAQHPLLGVTLALINAPFVALQRELFRLPVDSAQAMLALVAAAYVLRWLINRADGVPRDMLPWRYDLRTVLLFAGFFFASGLSYFNAYDIGAWAKEMLKWIQMALLYVLVANERNARVRALLLGAVFAAVAVQGVLGLYQFVFKGGAPDHFAILNKRFYRAFGSMQQPNPFAGLMGLTWPVALATAIVLWFEHRPGLHLSQWRAAVTTSRWRRWLGTGALLTCGLALMALVASWSRGGWLAAGAAAFAFALVASGRPLLALGVVVTGLALAYSSDLVAFLPGSLRTRLFGFLTDFSSIDVRTVEVTTENFATIERLAHWQAAYGMIAENFWLGVGLGNYEAAYESYRTLVWRNALGHAHNYYLNIFAETGVLGFLTYIAFWFYATARAARLAQQRNPQGWLALGIFAALVHMHVHHMVDNLFVSNLWLFMGVLLGLMEHTTAQNAVALEGAGA